MNVIRDIFKERNSSTIYMQSVIIYNGSRWEGKISIKLILKKWNWNFLICNFSISIQSNLRNYSTKLPNVKISLWTLAKLSNDRKKFDPSKRSIWIARLWCNKNLGSIDPSIKSTQNKFLLSFQRFFPRFLETEIAYYFFIITRLA